MMAILCVDLYFMKRSCVVVFVVRCVSVDYDIVLISNLNHSFGMSMTLRCFRYLIALRPHLKRCVLCVDGVDDDFGCHGGLSTIYGSLSRYLSSLFGADCFISPALSRNGLANTPALLDSRKTDEFYEMCGIILLSVRLETDRRIQ